MIVLVVSFGLVDAEDGMLSLYSYPFNRMEMKGNNTLESCSTSENCRDGLQCKSFGFTSTPPSACTSKSTFPCYCFPPQPVRCSAQSKTRPCPTGETCAQSTGRNLLCIGCKALVDLASRYEAITKGACDEHINGTGIDDEDDGGDDNTGNPQTPRPPSPVPVAPGRSGDLCSVVFKCARDLKCIDSIDSYKCAMFSRRCHCVPKRGSFVKCESSKTCKKREVCALNTIEGDKYCVSCDAAQTYFFLNLVDDNDPKCKKIDEKFLRPIPYYPESSDGYTLDTCSHKIQCRDDLECRAFGGKKNCTKNSPFCVCKEPNNQFHKCNTSTECQNRREGEVCATGRDGPLDNGPVCVSHIYDQENFPNDVIVRPPFPKYGFRVTGEACFSELDCVQNLACTHPSEDFGGCAGRRGCKCAAIRRHVCEEDGDCPGKESCVNVRGAKNKNYCKAESAIDRQTEISSRLAQRVVLPTNKTKLKWIGDFCNTSDECAMGDHIKRKCLNLLQRFGECDDPNSACVCKAVFPISKNSKVEKSNAAECAEKDDCGQMESCVQYLDTVSRSKKPGFCLSHSLADKRVYSFLDEKNKTERQAIKAKQARVYL